MSRGTGIACFGRYRVSERLRLGLGYNGNGFGGAHEKAVPDWLPDSHRVRVSGNPDAGDRPVACSVVNA
jgi:hypothetical protein